MKTFEGVKGEDQGISCVHMVIELNEIRGNPLFLDGS